MGTSRAQSVIRLRGRVSWRARLREIFSRRGRPPPCRAASGARRSPRSLATGHARQRFGADVRMIRWIMDNQHYNADYHWRFPAAMQRAGGKVGPTPRTGHCG